MTAGTGAPPIAAPIHAISFRSRIYGFGSIYGKTVRDSRLAFIIAAGLLGGMALVMGAAIGQVFPTPLSRLEIDKLIGAMPAAMVNLFGKPEKLGTLGGYMSWKYGAMFALGTALWSIMALSGTLAGEAGKGSLDMVAASPFGKRRIALEKLAAHATMLGLAMAILALMTTISSNAFGDAGLGDQIAPLSAIGFALWVGFIALFFGGLAFALGPILGRAGSAGVAAAVMLLAWVASGLQGLESLATFSPFHWTVNHVALAGEYDWPGLALVGVVAVALLVVGLELFARRDLGVTAGLSLPGLPAAVLGVRGSVSRAFGDQLPRALSWGIGLFIWGVILASLVGTFAKQIGQDTSLVGTFGAIFPMEDLTTAGGWLQLYAQLFLIAAGFAAATFVSKWASDETGGRLEMVLATPMARSKWVLSGGIAAILSVTLITVMFAAGIAIGAASGGVSPGDAVLGSAYLGLFAAAIVGIGVAIGGLWRTSLAAEIAAVVVLVTYLIDLLAPALKLPDWFHQLALTSHLGTPMVGVWDPVGIVACLAIAVGGVLIGAWGITRRDIVR
jgi:ABC-2 type transport system permease protein